MRIVAIGLGGAGCRIVDSLYSTDRRSSKVACVQGLAVDISESTLQQLTGLPDSAKICFPAMDPEISNRDRGAEPTATIDIAEIISRIHNFESGETDAIFFCLGLGGSMADIAPHIITGLRSSIVEPIFGLVTLPCLAEGEKQSAKAADDIEILAPLLDGMILFDNETWYKKTKSLMATLAKKEKSLANRLGFGKADPELSPELATYQLLNEAIVRRISLILRAGEFKADGGIELAEVVLDSGEVLNTMKGMGFITIGYAVERLPANPLGFLSQFRPQGLFNEENKKKASRIVELAKQAIYHEISTPCDMTSAHKALILIAGPSHELSMKGFMTVRKWIDRSIAGLETRSGDYPVMNTKNVAIIIMLSGLENIPRISELHEIRAQFTSGSHRYRGELKTPDSGYVDHSGDSEHEMPGTLKRGNLKDEMIVLPIKMRKEKKVTTHTSERTASHTQIPHILKPASTHQEPDLHEGDHERTGQQVRKNSIKEKDRSLPPLEDTTVMVNDSQSKSSRRQVVITKDKPSQSFVAPGSHTQNSHPIASVPHKPVSQESGHPTQTTKDAARQRIELDLQKQRIKAISGREMHPGDEMPVSPPATQETVQKKPDIHTRPVVIRRAAEHSGDTTASIDPEQKTVIIPRRKRVATPPVEDTISDSRDGGEGAAETKAAPPTSPNDYSTAEIAPDEMTIELKDTPYRAKDRIFEGRSVRRANTTTQVKDASLIHTSLKPKKVTRRDENDETEESDPKPESGRTPVKNDKNGKKQDDISWI